MRSWLCLAVLLASCSSPLGSRDGNDASLAPCPGCDASGGGGVVVDAGPLTPTSARIAPATSTLNIDDQITFTVWLVNEQETLVPTESDPSYVSSQADVMTVGVSGAATALSAGSTTVSATLDGFSAQASIEVIGPMSPDAGAGPPFDVSGCCPSVANPADPTDINMCYAGGAAPPSSADPDCPMVFSGGYCANPSETDFSNGDWDRGYNEAHEYCCSFHPGASGC